MNYPFIPIPNPYLKLLVVFCFLWPVFGYAQPFSPNVIFSYSIIEFHSGDSDQLEIASEKILSDVNSIGGTAYAIWTVASKPESASFAGLADNQLGVMIAWPDDEAVKLNRLNQTMEADTSVAIISSRLFEPIYLPFGLEVPTGKGFYVHREEEYRTEDVEIAFRLSREAWTTWEPHWGVKVVGLFREIRDSTDVVNLNRIVWYPSYDTWLSTRNFAEDPESAARFRERRTMLVPESGIAIATDLMSF